MNILARIRSYDELAAALKTIRESRGVSQTVIEQSVGWDYEYLWKLESKRKYPAGKMEDWLTALDVDLLIVPREHSADKQSNFPASPMHYRQLRKKLGAKGGRARDRNLGSDRKRDIARHAARARWKKGRGK